MGADDERYDRESKRSRGELFETISIEVRHLL